MSEPITAEDLHLAQWRERLQDAIDEVLAPAEASQVHAHLALCPICAHTHRRLLAIDATLRTGLAAAPAPSVHFDQKVFAAIAAEEQDKRAAARQQELQEYATLMRQWRNRWHELGRFHLGSIIGAIATLTAVASAITSTWPSLSNELAGMFSWLPGGNSLLPLSVIASATIAVGAILITRHLDRRPG